MRSSEAMHGNSATGCSSGGAGSWLSRQSGARRKVGRRSCSGGLASGRPAACRQDGRRCGDRRRRQPVRLGWAARVESPEQSNCPNRRSGRRIEAVDIGQDQFRPVLHDRIRDIEGRRLFRLLTGRFDASFFQIFTGTPHQGQGPLFLRLARGAFSVPTVDCESACCTISLCGSAWDGFGSGLFDACPSVLGSGIREWRSIPTRVPAGRRTGCRRR